MNSIEQAVVDSESALPGETDAQMDLCEHGEQTAQSQSNSM